MTHIWISHVSMSQVYMSHVAHMTESWHTCELVMSPCHRYPRREVMKNITSVILLLPHLFLSMTPSTQSNLFPNLICFFYNENHKVSTSIRGGFQVLLHKIFLEQVHSARLSCTADARPLTGFEKGPNSMEIPSFSQRTGLGPVRKSYR